MMDKIEYYKLNPKQVIHVFKEFDFQINRNLKRSNLLKVLRNDFQLELKELKNVETTAQLSLKEAKRFRRLNNAEHLTETQLESEFEYYYLGGAPESKSNVRDKIQTFLEGFWADMLQDIKEHPHSQMILDKFSEMEALIDPFMIARGYIHHAELNSIIVDDDATFDGLSYADLRKKLYLTSDIKELLVIAKKYDVDVPKSFNKEDLKKRLRKGLIDKSLLDSNREARIEKATVKELKAMLEEHHLPADTYLVKKDIIEYIMKHAKTISHLYVEPIHEDVYGEVQEEIQEEIQEVMVHNIKKEEPQIEEPQKVYADWQEDLKTIIKNQEEMIKILRLEAEERTTSKRQKMLERIYTYTIFILILFVALIWIVYVFNNFVLV